MPTGTITTYDLTTGVIVDIDPMIRMLDPTEVPLQSGAGSDGSEKSALQIAAAEARRRGVPLHLVHALARGAQARM